MSSERSVDRPVHPRRIESELTEALLEDEAKQGRSLSPREREAFRRGYEARRTEIRGLSLQDMTRAALDLSADRTE